LLLILLAEWSQGTWRCFPLWVLLYMIIGRPPNTSPKHFVVIIIWYIMSGVWTFFGVLLQVVNTLNTEIWQ
jgi:hypothetical protein